MPVGQRTVDVHVRRLRAKLDSRGPAITTIRGVGYRLDTVERVRVEGESSVLPPAVRSARC